MYIYVLSLYLYYYTLLRSHQFEKLVLGQISLVKMMTRLCDVVTKYELRITNFMASATY